MPFDTTDAAAKDQALTAAIVDMSPAMRRAVEIVADCIETNFRSESSAGEAWQPLAPRTVEDRERKGYGGAHEDRVRDNVLRNTASAHRVATRDGAEVGPDGCEYAGAQADGTYRIPARDFLAQTDLTINAIEDAIIAHLEANDG